MGEHTPGPWTIEPDANSHFFDGRIVGADGSSVAFVDIDGADATLILATPDLLAVARAALTMAELAATLTGCRADDDYVAEFEKKVRDALAKAEGQAA